MPLVLPFNYLKPYEKLTLENGKVSSGMTLAELIRWGDKDYRLAIRSSALRAANR